jgi:hypothetical protein
MTRPTIILITESTSESWKRDASTFFLAFACFAPGWFLGMWSMSLLGLLILAYMTGKSVLNIGGKALSLGEARSRIDEIERAQGEGE